MPGHAAELDDVADPNLALEEDDDAADEVLDDRLRAKADANGQRTTHEGKNGQWNARQIENENDQPQREKNHHPAAYHRSQLVADAETADQNLRQQMGEARKQPVADNEQQ